MKVKELLEMEDPTSDEEIMEIEGPVPVKDHPDSTVTCQYCRGSIPFDPNERSIRISCPQCGKDTLNERSSSDLNPPEN